jgi:threonine/homoserine/homoserine lactone efflux protein
MSLVLPFLFGFIAAIVGVTPPGLINLTAAKVSLANGKKPALTFVLGAIIIIFIQTYISVLFARIIDKNQNIVMFFRVIGLFVFIILTIYFFQFAQKQTLQNTSQNNNTGNFLMTGMGISAINFFPIPYYVFISITLASFKVFSFQIEQILALVIGVVLGSFLIFYCYIAFFNRIKNNATKTIQNMNKIIGSITAIVAVLTLYNILKYYFKF